MSRGAVPFERSTSISRCKAFATRLSRHVGCELHIEWWCLATISLFRASKEQVWDDGSLLPSASGLNLSTDTIQGRRVRRAYLLAEAVITVPMRTLLGITRVDANDAKDANERPVGCRPAQVCGKSNRLASLDSVASTYGLLTPPRGAVSSAFLTSGQQSIQISLSFRLEVC